MESHTVVGSGRTELRVDAAGPPDAPTILLVHGYSQSRLCWYEQFDGTLTEDFRLIAPDLRGHGDSDKPTGSDRYRDPGRWAADLGAVIDELATDDPVLVGWSYGGLVVADYLAVEGTDDVAGVVFVGAITEKGTDAAADVAGEEFAAMLGDLETRDAEASVDALGRFLDICTAEPVPPRERHLMLGYNARCPPRVREALQARTGANAETLRDLDVPALFAHGSADRVVLSRAARRHADLVPDGEVSIYEGVGHSPFLEAPERFDRELREFVRRVVGE
ncbi:Pimeloyl-ACP methyl ester carboxylesterase [Halorubrum aquaticum]|uniref:Pimeloyl-ACP methyl ester carboxylesterase n=1 Tax=Halorubrum aquaticum TaxID=387340 RepID=A0A1I3CV36_9EURY|nr:alpha/beta hydrolase [Halorubrum aquaticum]SFH78370.1 Pimeloyl-ACP methyl ester carboxylesterase [Halorubrum aquaticum]